MNMLCGWTLEQWAHVAGRYHGYEPTLEGALKLRLQWWKRSATVPLTSLIAGYDYPKDYGWATAMFLDAASKLSVPA